MSNVRYNPKFGYIYNPSVIAGVRPLRQPLYRTSILSGLGEHPWMSGGQCQNFQNLVTIYTRLSQKKDKSAATRQNAAKMAADNRRLYQECLAKKQAAATPAMPATPVTPVTPVTTPSYPSYYPYYGGGGGGYGYTPVAAPELPAPEPPVAQPPSGIVQYGTHSSGQTLYRVVSTGQIFYYDPTTGAPVYLGAPQPQVPQTLPETPLTPVAYVPMPANGGMPTELPADTSGYAAVVSSAPVVSSGQPPVAQAVQAPEAARYAVMPGYEDAVASGQTINEIDFLGQRNIEYHDKWGKIRVLRIVVPKDKVETLKQKAVTQASQGASALPGGVMDVQAFTADYVLA